MKVLKGKKIEKYIDKLGNFRIDIFREYPYLYEGNLEHERKYLSRYSFSPEGILLLIEDERGLVGACTGIPLKEEDEEFTAPFKGSKIDEIFYIGEIMVRKDCRGQGLGERLMSRMLSLVDKKRYKKICFYTVDRGDNHPQLPEGYSRPDAFWEKLGFTKDPEKMACYRWRDIGESEESAKPMNVWIKQGEAGCGP